MGNYLYIGIDVGSTTIKLVIMNENMEIIESFYSRHFSDTKKSIFDSALHSIGFPFISLPGIGGISVGQGR